MSERDFERFVALGLMDDWSGEWHTAQICKTIHNSLLDLQRRGGMVFASPSDKDYRSETDFLLKFAFESPKKPKKKPLTQEQQIRMFQKMAGL